MNQTRSAPLASEREHMQRMLDYSKQYHPDIDDPPFCEVCGADLILVGVGKWERSCTCK